MNLVTVRGRPYSPGVGALVREAMRKRWFGSKAIAARLAEEGAANAASSRIGLPGIDQLRIVAIMSAIIIRLR